MSITASKIKHATRAQRRHIAFLYGSYPTDTLSRHEASLLITSMKAARERIDILQDVKPATEPVFTGGMPGRVDAQGFLARKLAT